MSKRQLPALTGLRFFLAIWVVIYHQLPPVESALASFPVLQHTTTALLQTGYSAVTAFFILSGFVLAYNYDLVVDASPALLRKFSVARFSRIYPAYFCGLLLLVPLALYRFASGIAIMPLAQEWGSFLLNLLLLQAWFPHSALTWNFPGWSLSNEAFFYACFPFLGALLWRIERPKALTAAFLSLWALSCAAPLAAVLAPAYHWGDLPATTHVLPQDASIWANIVRYNPLLRLPEFCVGILLTKVFFWLTAQGRLIGHGPLLYWTGGLTTVAILSQAGNIPYPLLHNGLLIPSFACLILGLAFSGGWPAKLLSTPGLQLLGNASYSMYILHAPLYTWQGIFFRRILDQPPQGWIWFLSYLIVVILGSILFFKLVEEPAHRALRAKLSRPPASLVRTT